MFGLSSIAASADSRGMWSNPLARFTALNQKSAIPDGYNRSYIAPALKDGAMAAAIFASATVTAESSATGNMESTIAGAATLTANCAGAFPMSATIAGTASLTAGVYSPANLACTISIGASPSAFDIAQAVWQQNLAAFNDAGSAGKETKDKLTLAQFLGLK